jgi:coproporphyrinogen III oxidase
MQRILAKSPQSQAAYTMLTSLQSYFVTKLNGVSKAFGEDKAYSPVEWFRDEGQHGGGVRFVANDESVFNRASVNISQVQYEDDSNKNLTSATALSTIIHPLNPHASSIHMHISWTELKGGKGYWRVMADLNPSVQYDLDKDAFTQTLKEHAKEYFTQGEAGGNKYFNIPLLGRHRGVSHFYLEGFNSGDFESDIDFAQNIGERVVDTYIDIISNALKTRTEIDDVARKVQLNYHSLYLFQVLTLDRGTTSGLLVHNQNDVGTLGSIPKYVNVELLRSWIERMPTPQDSLLTNILNDLPSNGLVDDEVKAKLAQTVREHYQKYPEALKLQASGETIPDTVGNHK